MAFVSGKIYPVCYSEPQAVVHLKTVGLATLQASLATAPFYFLGKCGPLAEALRHISKLSKNIASNDMATNQQSMICCHAKTGTFTTLANTQVRGREHTNRPELESNQEP